MRKKQTFHFLKTSILLALLLMIGLGLPLGPGRVIHAQGAASAMLHLVNVQGFPSVAALLDVYDAQGQFITGLQPSSITVLEDNSPLPVNGLSESTPPAQIVAAINPGPALAVRDGEGIERYQRIVQALYNWAAARTLDPFDDLSLVTIAGPIITHAGPADWAVSLAAFQPDFRATTPNLQSLTLAFNIALEQTPLPGMKRAILFVTPHMDDPNIEQTVNAFIQQARQDGVRVFVWFVDADLYFDTPSATAFKSLALQSGGSYFAFSGLEALPDPETYFSPLRHLYSLSYTSTLSAGGEHTLAVQVNTPGGVITSESQTFSVDIQPPNPILVMPPAQITRQAPPDDPFNIEILLPDRQTIDIIIEFPDGHPRPLTRTTFYVDGQPVAQNEAEPFNHFTWDLSTYTQSGQHEVMVEAVDSLGLSKTSMALPITVTVIRPPTGIRAFLAKYRTWIAGSAVGLVGLILIIVLLAGRVRITSWRERREARQRYTDPVTQPVIVPATERPGKGKTSGEMHQANYPAWKRGKEMSEAPAYLVRLRPNGEPGGGHPIPLLEKEITFGTDPVQAAHVLDHPSISPLHARLQQGEGGEFLLTDQGSIAGTWVDYEPVSPEGRILKHGDVVHFGQLMYRFILQNPPPEAEPTITPDTAAL
ncbi:MAG: hypothetical protein Fur0043_07690 [Anaerolineales bacterium]